jgi:hypothetical protein
MEAALYCVHTDAAHAQQQKNGCIRSDLAPSEILNDPQVSHEYRQCKYGIYAI